jgi:hypothetical protein
MSIIPGVRDWPPLADPGIKLDSIAATLSTPQQVAADVVDRAGLVPFITHWNNGEASFIA